MPTNKQIQARAPTLLLLLGMICGLIAAKHTSLPLPLLLTGALLASCATIRLASSKQLKLVWALSFLATSTLLFCAYGQTRLPATPSPATLRLPPREAQLTFQIQRILQSAEDNSYGKASGIATVLDASPTSRLQIGAPIYFRLRPPTDESFQIQRGQQLQATAILSPIPPIEIKTDAGSTNTAASSFEDYLNDIGVHYRFERSRSIALIKPPSQFDRFCTQTNLRFQHYLRLGAPTDSDLPNVYIAMLLGRKAELSPAQKERYQYSGTMHFFAISGLHIGVIASVIAQFLILIRVPKAVSPWIGLPLLYLYVEITGGAPSAMRAFLMTAFFWASYACRRQRAPLPALVGSAIFVLAINPAQLWSLGFQLSYSVVLSILLFGLPLHALLNQHFAPYRWFPEGNWSSKQRALVWTVDKGWLLFAISFSAWLASTPLSAGLFDTIIPSAILLNMVLVNLVALIISGGIIALVSASATLTAVAAFLNHSAWLIISALDSIITQTSKIPGGILHCEHFPLSFSYAALTLYFADLFWIHQDRSKLHSPYMLIPPLTIFAITTAGLALS